MPFAAKIKHLIKFGETIADKCVFFIQDLDFGFTIFFTVGVFLVKEVIFQYITQVREI